MDKYINKETKEEKKIHFFSSSNNTSIAVDNSGSTYGNIMDNQKKIISNIISGTNCENLKNTILAWESRCKIEKLDNLDSSGGTDPSTIFEKLQQKVENLLITTDGEISTNKVNQTRQKIKNFKNLKNIICISFQESVSSPSDLNIAVFYPFLEHTKIMKGSFYLFFYRNNNICLLLKNIPKNVDSIFKSPPLEYTKETKWDDIPVYDISNIQKIDVTSFGGLEEGYIYIPTSDNSNKILNLKLLEKDILAQKANNDLSFVSSEEFNSFMKDNINGLIDSCVDSFESENFNKLRNIVAEWKKGLLNIEKEKEKERQLMNKNKNGNIEDKTKKIELYNELMGKKLQIKDKKSQEYTELIAQLKTLSKEIFDTVKEKLKKKNSEESKTNNNNKYIGDILERLTEEQNKLLNGNIINDFTLKNITKVANRVKRAEKLTTIESADNWDLSGKPVICDECLICTRDDQPMALLMIDLSEENPNLLEYNISDFSLNDEINTGTKNTCAIPSGEFCVECAYALMLGGKHPITRQKIGSVLVLADPSIKTNNKMIINSICCSLFGCREVKASFQILLGLFEELEKKEKMEKSENRFSPKVYEWIHKYVLYNTNANLLTEEFGTNKKLIEAMFDVVNYKFSPYDEDTWMIPLRNKTLKSMSIITRNVLMENKDHSFLKEYELKRKAITLMRRIFIKNIIISKVISICKNKVNGKDEKIYKQMCYLIENDLFNNNSTSFPLMNSEKICKFENSKMIQSLCRTNEELKDIVKTIKYFEEFIRNKYEDEHFELFTENMITLITLGIYILINDENNINDLCKAEEDALLGFLGVNQLKSHYTPEEKNIIHLNTDLFLYGNTKDISGLTKENLTNLIKSISLYSKIKVSGDQHALYLCKYASHLYSPCVTLCSVCGMSFVTDEEKEQLRGKNNVGEIVEKIKERKYKHIQEYCYTTNSFGFDEYTNIFPGHKIVRIICTMDKFKDLERPTRELIIEEIKYLKKMNRISRGNIYFDNLIWELLKFSWDFLQRKKNLNENQIKAIQNCLSFEKRVLIEIEESQDDYIKKEADLNGLTDEEIKEITQNINLNNCY